MKTYLLIYRCSNCGERFNVEIPCRQEALINLRCPNCELPTCKSEPKKDGYAWDGFILKNEGLMRK